MMRTVPLALLLCGSPAHAQVAQVAPPTWAKGAAVEVLWQGEWYPAQIVRANHGWYRIHYVGYADSWDEFVDGSRVRARQAERPKGPWSVGDAVEVDWKGSWYQAKVVEVNHGWSRIHYAGYDASGDEIVDESHIRAASPNAPIRGEGGPVELSKPPPTYSPPPAAPAPSRR
jgi:hypothetical protein